MPVFLLNWYPSDRTQRELSNEYQHGQDDFHTFLLFCALEESNLSSRTVKLPPTLVNSTSFVYFTWKTKILQIQHLIMVIEIRLPQNRCSRGKIIIIIQSYTFYPVLFILFKERSPIKKYFPFFDQSFACP